jgi:putative oxidoreductase
MTIESHHPKNSYLSRALLLLRVAMPVFFMAHAGMRIYSGTIPQFAGFLGSVGFLAPLAVVWLITAYELTAGLLIGLGIWVRWLVPGLMCIALGGIVLIHRHHGWFVGEHGTGGMEYATCLLLGLIVLQAQALDQRAKTATR